MQMLETFAAVLKTSEFWRKIPRSKYGLICRKNPGNWEPLKPGSFGGKKSPVFTTFLWWHIPRSKNLVVLKEIPRQLNSGVSYIPRSLKRPEKIPQRT